MLDFMPCQLLDCYLGDASAWTYELEPGGHGALHDLDGQLEDLGRLVAERRGVFRPFLERFARFRGRFVGFGPGPAARDSSGTGPAACCTAAAWRMSGRSRVRWKWRRCKGSWRTAAPRRPCVLR